MAFLTKIQPYSIITLDLTGARTDLAQGSITLRGVIKSSWIANTLTVLTLGGGTLALKLDQSTSDSIDLSEGLKIEGNTFREIYWTNVAQAAVTAKLYVAWVD